MWEGRGYVRFRPAVPVYRAQVPVPGVMRE